MCKGTPDEEVQDVRSITLNQTDIINIIIMDSTDHQTISESQPKTIIDLTSDSDTEYHWPSHKRIRKSTKFYSPPNNNDLVNKTTKKRSRIQSKTLSKKSPRCRNGYVGARIAKYFGVELYLGTVAFVDNFYHIVYDDGDEEDVLQEELNEMLKLYQSQSERLEYNANEKVHPSKLFTSVVHSSLSQKPYQKATRPMLFQIHNICPNKLEVVCKSLPRDLQSKTEVISEFFLLCYERQLIWQRKCAGLTELTKDIKLSKSFYCNVYRELDRGTQYFRSNLIQCRNRVDGRYDLEEVLWDSICYRLINKIETFGRYTKIPSREEWGVSQS